MGTDLLDEIATERKRLRLTRPEPLESVVQAGVLRALQMHPKVARVWRSNTGGAYLAGKRGGTQYVRFGFAGSPDIHGFMKTGRAIYVECKRPTGKVTAEQREFLDAAGAAGCIAFVARSIDDVFEHLGR